MPARLDRNSLPDPRQGRTFQPAADDTKRTLRISKISPSARCRQFRYQDTREERAFRMCTANRVIPAKRAKRNSAAPPGSGISGKLLGAIGFSNVEAT